MPDGLKLLPAELQAMLDEPQRPLVFLDVRPAREVEAYPSPFPEVVAIPLGELEFQWEELEEDDEIVIVDHKGLRGVRALQFLEARGFERLWMLKGGLAAWAAEIDPAFPTYEGED
ncbi:MAG: rhodanese-like domain-containing protein [Nitrospirota bacterium]|jgi:rhodanese-related sulfurtransferase